MRSLRTVASWVALGALVGIACGVGSAAFLFALEWMTHFRSEHLRIVYALPVAGLLVGALYDRYGRGIVRGNDLVIDTIHEDRARIPLRMGPMVLVGTVVTHLFGGSAGREGTAVQMGASFADAIAHRVGATGPLRRELLAAGIAGGFGAVFGTPIAGLVFGLEVLTVGRLEYAALVPALVASLVGDRVTRALGVVHVGYPAIAPQSLDPLLAMKWLVFAAAIAAATIAFIGLTHAIKTRLTALALPLRMALGGVVIVVLWRAFGTERYLGLGVPTIVGAFQPGGVPAWAFAAKILFTAVTLGAGFLGGEVTPLFFIGATLGAALSIPLHLPLPLAAGVGLAAVFAAAANTPLALSIMAVELMGAAILPHVLLVSVVAYLLTGQRGIYSAQRILRAKHGGASYEPRRLGATWLETPGADPAPTARADGPSTSP